MTGPVTTEALVARIAELEAKNAQLAVERNEALAMRRWNIDRTDGGEVLVCRGYHDKGEDCDHERLVPEERLATATSELARLRAEGEAKDRDNAVTALMVIALCNSVLGNAYLGKEGEEELAGHVKAAFTKPALARAATAREG